jgi:uncharacterized YccA/Bax inhibitor family protein
MRTSNPALNDQVFRDAAVDSRSTGTLATSPGLTMTLEGTVAKTGILLAILVAAAGFTWLKVTMGQDPNAATVWSTGGAIAGLILALATTFKPTWSPYSAPLYAAAEGLFLGGISAVFELQYPGIAFQAIAGTLGTLAALLFAYATGLVRATENFKLGVVAATGGICLVYVVQFVLSMFGSGIPGIFAAGWVGIGFSLFVVAIAAMNLVLDFDFIENGVRQACPKYMEWYAGFGLLVTLVWLYLEILRLLSKLRSRD